MKRACIIIALLMPLSGCIPLNEFFCAPDCHSETHNSTSLVGFLYPDGKLPPPTDTIPELHLPLRVGLTFLPSQNVSANSGLESVRKEELMERIRKRFADRKFVADIVIIPDYYLNSRRGYDGLQGVQRLYNVDVMAIISYDQTTHMEDNNWSLSYFTIVGAYVVKGSRHDLSTLIDLAVVDPTSRSLLLRAGGTDVRHGNSTMIDQERETREASAAGFSTATDHLIDNFDLALTKFENDVKNGTANVKVVHRESHSHGGGGGGAFTFGWIIALALMMTAQRNRNTRQFGDW